MMKPNKQTIILLFLGVITCQRTVRNDANLFNLEDDKMIINTPDVQDLHSGESSIFKYDESTPFKNGVFFMQDDFFVDVHDHAEPPMNPHKDEIIEEPVEERT